MLNAILSDVDTNLSLMLTLLLLRTEVTYANAGTGVDSGCSSSLSTDLASATSTTRLTPTSLFPLQLKLHWTSRLTLASPALTGVPTAPTAAADTNTTQIATTAYVQTELTDLIERCSCWSGYPW